MPNAIWKGSISFGLVSIPVSLYSAETKRELSFHLLDGRDMAPVRNRRVNQVTGEEVPWEEIVKGYPLEDGRWVVVTDDDLRAANVQATQTIDILGAVCAEDIPIEYFDKPYRLEPMKPGRKAYALLRETLSRARRAALATIVIRTRQHLAAIVPRAEMLVLEILRFPYELRDASDLDLPSADLAKEGVTEAEIAMAEQLVAAMESDWRPAEYHDTYHDDLLALIHRKAEEGEAAPPPPPPAYEPGAEVVDIMALLKRSVEEADSERESAAGPQAAAGGRG